MKREKKPKRCNNQMFINFYEVWQYRNRIHSLTLYWKKIRQSKCYPLQCSPLPDPYTAPCELSTVGRKQCCRSSCVMLFKSCVAFAFTASTDSNLVPLSADLIFRKRKKSHGAGSGEYGGCSVTGMLFFAKYLFTDSALCAGALSWWRIHEAFFNMSGLLRHTRSRRVVKTFL